MGMLWYMLTPRSDLRRIVKSPDQLCIHRMRENHGQNRGPARTRGSTEQPSEVACPRSNRSGKPGWWVSMLWLTDLFSRFHTFSIFLPFIWSVDCRQHKSATAWCDKTWKLRHTDKASPILCWLCLKILRSARENVCFYPAVALLGLLQQIDETTWARVVTREVALLPIKV